MIYQAKDHNINKLTQLNLIINTMSQRKSKRNAFLKHALLQGPYIAWQSIHNFLINKNYDDIYITTSGQPGKRHAR